VPLRLEFVDACFVEVEPNEEGRVSIEGVLDYLPKFVLILKRCFLNIQKANKPKSLPVTPAADDGLSAAGDGDNQLDAIEEETKDPEHVEERDDVSVQVTVQNVEKSEEQSQAGDGDAANRESATETDVDGDGANKEATPAKGDTIE
jgi:hypothetical protein